MSDNLPAEHPGSDDPSVALSVIRAVLAFSAAGLGIADPLVGAAAAGVIAGTDSWMPALVNAASRRLRSVGRVFRFARQESGLTDEELVDLAASTPLKQLVVGNVCEAAMRTVLDEKIAALGRALAIALLADTDVEVEKQRKLVAALAQLEAPDVQLLELVSGDYRQSKHAGGGDRLYAGGWTLDLIGKELPELVVLIPPLVAGLVGAGLVAERGSSPGDFAAVPGYLITAFGRLVLGSLAAARANLHALESEGQQYPPDL